MKRLVLVGATTAVLLAALWLAPPVTAQGVSSVVVSTSIKGVRFLVDGREYQTVASFFWPAGSKHILEFPLPRDGFQFNDLYTSRYSFASWRDSTGVLQPTGSSVQTVTADPRVTSYVANVTAEHQVNVSWYQGGPSVSPGVCGAPGSPSPPEPRVGVVYIDGTCYWNNIVLWMQEGTHNLNAFPYPGYVFIGFAAQIANDTFLRTFTVTGPNVLYARFSPAKRVKFRTDPVGLRVRVDREDVFTPDLEPCAPNNFLPPGPPGGVAQMCIGDFDFAPGSAHLIGAPSPQLDRGGRTWVFDGFANGLGQNSTYNTSVEVFPEETLVARFVRGVSTSITSKPPGFKLKIDDRDNWPEPYFVFTPGSKHTVSAPNDQTDSRGRRYVFRRWSNGGTATQEVTVPAEVDMSFVLVAEYDLQSQLVIRSNPAGTTLSVDGVACVTPCKLDRADGVEIRLAAPDKTPLGDGQRLDFTSWSDGGARERTFKLSGPDVQSLTMNFRTAYQLSLVSDPPDGARFQVDPPSPDAFYASDAVVTVSASAQPGFRFRRWDGDLTGTGRTVVMSMNRPRNGVARFDRVPYIQPAGIRNAAGITPEGVVAPGSLVTIAGANLAPFYEAGPDGPILSQALAGVSVLIGNRILPLIFVSPDQINAQLPRDLELGDYQLRVIRIGQPDVTGEFIVVRSAPGLFNQTVDGQPFVVGTHEDGTPITSQSPARRGERITLSGTGFGPYELRHPEGFVLPPAPSYPLMYTPEVQLGEITAPTVWAGGAPGRVGVDVVQFRVPEEAAGSAPLKIRIDGRESNTVYLSVE